MAANHDPFQRPSRRRLLDWLLGTSGVAVLGSMAFALGRFLVPPRARAGTGERADAGRTNDPDYLDRGYKIGRLGADPVIVLRVEEGDFRAFSAVCTHLDCIVTYLSNQRVIFCNCHAGKFDLQGQVIAGPPPRPLRAYQVQLVADGAGERQVVVTRA